MAEVIYTVGGLYLLTGLLIWLGLERKSALGKVAVINNATVVLCARDETADLPACLDSLEKQEIESQRLEIILVNDASQDRTAALFEEFAGRSRFRVQVLHLLPAAVGEPTGKWRPLNEGIKAAHSDAILMTDADAVLPPRWVAEHLRELQSAEMSAGFILVSGEGAWRRLQRWDWLYLQGVGRALTNWNQPQSAFGKNQGLRREAYAAVGGLEGIGFTLTEDVALVRAIVRRGMKLTFSRSPSLAVATPGVDSFAQFLRQRQRWATGIRHIGLAGKALIAVSALRDLTVLLGLLIAPLPALLIWVATISVDAAILIKTTSELRLKLNPATLLLWELFRAVYAWILAVRLILGQQVQWKGRKLEAQ